MRFLTPLIVIALASGCAPTASDSADPEPAADSQAPQVPEASETPSAPEATGTQDFTNAEFLYSASVTGTDFDILTTTDPTSFCRLEYTGRSQQEMPDKTNDDALFADCLLYTSPSPRDATLSRMPSSA